MAEWKKILLEGLDLSGTDVSNNAFTVSDSEGTPNTTDITLGDTLTFAASGDLSVIESAGTITYSFTAGATTNSFTTIDAPNGTDPVADTSTSTLTLTNGNGITITGNSSTDTIDIKVPDGGIDTLQLAAAAVETAKIADANVTTAKIADANVTTAKIADSNVTFAKMAGAAVITASETIASNDSDTAFPTAAAVIDYVEAQVTASDLDFQGDTGGALSIDLDSETLTIAGTANEIETAGSGNTLTIGLPNDVTVTGQLTVNGGLDVNGTLTTIDTTNLRVEDHLIQLNNTTTPSTTNANDGGIEVMTGDATSDPQVFWSNNSHLAGWSLRKAGNATTAGRIMVQLSTAGDPTDAPIAGVGTMHYASTSKSMFVYVDS